MPITTGAYLYLSGTPFRALHSGEFIEEQIFAWTYSDEQRAKAEWNDADGPNPYAVLPRMVMMTYQLPEALQAVAKQGEFNEFDLNLFFAAEGLGDDARFRYEDEVQRWLDLIRGAYSENIVSDLKLRIERPPMPFSHAPLLATLTHNSGSCLPLHRVMLCAICWFKGKTVSTTIIQSLSQRARRQVLGSMH